MLEGFGLGEGALFRMVRSCLSPARAAHVPDHWREGDPGVDLLRLGSNAPECAGRIHTDFQRGFIKRRSDPLGRTAGASAPGTKAKELGKIRIEGKDYHPVDGDVMEFRFNV